MRDCKVGILADDAASWLDRDRMTLDGFEYGCIAEDSPNDAALREQWLSMQKEPQTPQPYIQAAKVFRASGRDADATAILVAKEEALLEHGKLGQAERCWMHLMDWTVRFGYTPLRALKGTAFFVFLGSILFGFGYRERVITPTEDKAFHSFVVNGCPPNYYELFNTIVYSLETFLPLVELDQRKNWFPNPTQGPRLYVFGSKAGYYISFGDFLRCYLWFHTMMGWFFATAIATGVAVLLRTK